MKKLFLLLLIVLLGGCTSNKSLYKTITYDEVTELNNEVIILDVRTSSEYKGDHIENAINIPLDNINKEELIKIIDNKEINIVVYCRSGYRSKIAAEKLIDFGYVNVFDLGSIENWSE